MILPIIKYPAKVLRTKTKKVTFPLSPANKKLVRDMHDTVKKADGIGLAAPQVGQSQAIIVVDLQNMGLAPFALLNPEVLESSRKKTDLEEGCLSIPGVFGIVPRPEKITFRGQNIEGQEIIASADGMLAKVLQHEIDHINGILILDKIKKYTQGQDLIKK